MEVHGASAGPQGAPDSGLSVRSHTGAWAPKHYRDNWSQATRVSASSMQRWVLGDPLKGSPPHDTEKGKDKKLPSVQLASFQESEPGWQAENSPLMQQMEPGGRADQELQHHLPEFSLCTEACSRCFRSVSLCLLTYGTEKSQCYFSISCTTAGGRGHFIW